MVELISPGGFNQDFPSYHTALTFCHVLAASITFSLEEPPGYLKHICQPGTEVVYDSRGKHWEKLSNDVKINWKTRADLIEIKITSIEKNSIKVALGIRYWVLVLRNTQYLLIGDQTWIYQFLPDCKMNECAHLRRG